MVLLRNESGKDVVYPVRLAENPYVPATHKTVKAGATAELPPEFLKVEGFVEATQKTEVQAEPIPSLEENEVPTSKRSRKK